MLVWIVGEVGCVGPQDLRDARQVDPMHRGGVADKIALPFDEE